MPYEINLIFFAFFIKLLSGQQCRDLDVNCREWIAFDSSICGKPTYVKNRCLKSCGMCPSSIDTKFDITRLSKNLRPMAWLVGVWRSEHGGKAMFPTIPKFTYGEQIEFSIPHSLQSFPALNYTSSAWSATDMEPLHSEHGFITSIPDNNFVSLTTVMDNGFVSVEEGQLSFNRIRLRLHDVGRLSFSRDLPVHDTVREWTLMGTNMLQQKFDMETLTHRMQEHTLIRYSKVYP